MKESPESQQKATVFIPRRREPLHPASIPRDADYDAIREAKDRFYLLRLSLDAAPEVDVALDQAHDVLYRTAFAEGFCVRESARLMDIIGEIRQLRRARGFRR